MSDPKGLYYSDYLSLETILNAQNLESVKRGTPAHDEMLFIVIHQTFELWFKQFLFELDSVLKLFERPHLQDEEMNIAVSRLKRMVSIQRLMIRQFDVLETMSPSDFLSFRDFLIPASGFQSAQFKLIEKKLGIVLSNAHKDYSLSVLNPNDLKKINQEEGTLLSGISEWLARNPFANMDGYSFEKEYKKAIEHFLDSEMKTIQNHPLLTPEKMQEESKRLEMFRKNLECLFDDKLYDQEMVEGKKRLSRKAFLSALFVRLYRHFAILQMPYQILDLLIDINEHHVRWKQRHLLIIQRMIGLKMGTGGTSGRDFLENTIRQSNVFSDLIEMPSYMLGKKYVPTLPKEITKKLGYVFA